MIMVHLLNHLFLHKLGHPFGLCGGDLLDEAVHLVAQALDLLVPLREDLARCGTLSDTLWAEFRLMQSWAEWS